ncbi:MAG: hypothetical protein AB1529_07655 [Candidatus Micrarchaeota archaeon]
MEPKILVLLVLASTLLIAGCAKKGPSGNATGEITAPAGTLQPSNGASQPEPNKTVQPPAAGNAGGTAPVNATTSEPQADTQGLADLFNITTEKPLADEGLETGTPSSANK